MKQRLYYFNELIHFRFARSLYYLPQHKTQNEKKIDDAGGTRPASWAPPALVAVDHQRSFPYK